MDDGLALFEIPRAVIEPLLRSLRSVNTAVDAIFYDVGALWLRLLTRGITISVSADPRAIAAPGDLAALHALMTHVVNLSALTDPEGVILVVDARRPPFIERYGDVREFLSDGLEFPSRVSNTETPATPRTVRTASV